MQNNLQSVELFEEGSNNLWTDPYIESHLLGIFLDNSHDEGSRRLSIRNKEINFIYSFLKETTKPKILDLACGPGFYTHAWAKKGALVFGFDVGISNIIYANQQATNDNLNIVYRTADILYEKEFVLALDLVCLIYGTYSTFSKEARLLLIKRILPSLKKGSILALDVMTANYIKSEEESDSLDADPSQDFWDVPPYVLQTNTKYFQNNEIYCKDYQILKHNYVSKHFRLWYEAFTIEKIKSELEVFGFERFHFYDAFSGKPVQKNSKFIGVICTYHGNT